MSTTAKPRLMRMNQKAVLVPVAQFARWYTIASATAGLSELDRAMLDVIAGYYRELGERGVASFPSIKAMAQSSGARTIDVSGAIRNLVGLALIAVRPGSGPRRNVYLPALPKRIAASMLTAAADAVPALQGGEGTS
jgi:hypothetical protein